MDYTGKKVFHKARYGEGTIVSQDEQGRIYVRFEGESELKLFIAPACFKQFLQLRDRDAADAVEKEISRIEAAEMEKKGQDTQDVTSSKQAESTQSRQRIKDVSVPSYASLSEFFEQQAKDLQAEISFLKKGGGKRIKLLDGKLVESRNSRAIYSFESDSELNLPDNTLISLWLASSKEAIPAVVVNCEDFTVIIASSAYLGDTVPMIEFSAEPWRLLSSLIDGLQSVCTSASRIVKALVCDGRKMADARSGITKGQEAACRMSLSQDITFIWGPPGTGKTETLANIAHEHMQKGHRVLMLSYSNVSVDGAIWRVFQKDTDARPGKLVRYGYPRDKALLQHEFLTSYNLTLRNHPQLMKERANLIVERKRVFRASPRYVEIGRKLASIRRKLDEEEKDTVSAASFVATTVSKAIVDSTVNNGDYDTVIFDESSMAYIPQIVFSAGLARKHFICIGDFAQLPPIVQSSKSSGLNADIFRFCGITDAVYAGYGHKWLCMLDTQYRMHPEIAAFASQNMYRGLLRSGEKMEAERKQILQSIPFSGDALRFVDLSGMMSVCTKTADQSRINVLSAFIAFGLAINAARDNEVGIITPYNAQSRLFHAMSRDAAELAPDLHKITCATVHQFQGSEKDVILYDAVDCYRMPYPGTLLSSTANNYANRLYNVAVTRAKGKMISIANVDYMMAKNLSQSLIFRRMIDSLKSRGKITHGEEVISTAGNHLVSSYSLSTASDAFVQDISAARKEISIDIPGGMSGSLGWLTRLSETLTSAKKRGVRIHVRVEDKSSVPIELRPFAIENRFIANPISLIDRSVAWFGMPFSEDNFVAEGKTIPTRFRPILRFQGIHFARSLYGFLEMDQTIDSPVQPVKLKEDETYDSFAAYVAGEIKCPSCGGQMKLKKSNRGQFFLSCSNYPKCEGSQFIKPETVENYFYFRNRKGKRCPQDNTSLEAKIGRRGLYICCNSLNRHYYNLDEI